ncbi:MAG: hypothetical protein QXR68_08355 [Pyrobaculum sp.]
MFQIVAKSVKVGLVFVLMSVLYTLFFVWWQGVLDVYPLLVGVYLMTFISITPYIIVTVANAVRDRRDGRWVVTVGLSGALMMSLVAALVKLGQLRAAVSPFVIYNLKFDSTLALSLVLLGLSTLIYIGSVVPEGGRLARAVYFSVVEGNRDDDEIKTV